MQEDDGVISIHLDGDNGTLAFLFNDEIIGESVNVKKNETYYVFVSYNSAFDAEFTLIGQSFE